MTAVGLGGVAPPWVPDGPNHVIIAGGQQSVEAILLGNAPYGRATGTSASASAGTGGWQVTDRSRQKAATEWLDYYPFAMTMKLRLDDAVQGQGQTETGILILEQFEMPTPGTRPPLPPILALWGPVPHTDLAWVCSRLDFAGGDDDVIQDASGNRTMQNLTIELTEYSPSTAIVSDLTPAQAAAQVGAAGLAQGGVTSGSTTVIASGKTYTVKAGDTLTSIAANVVGNVNDFANLAILNGLSLGAILTPGQVLQLPAP